MARPKRWYDPEATEALRVVPREDRETSYVSLRWKHPRVRPGLGECLAYPLSDAETSLPGLTRGLLWGVGIALLAALALSGLIAQAAHAEPCYHRYEFLAYHEILAEATRPGYCTRGESSIV